mmetsp:Transcript_12453/g.40853  ORF Transcript_12453/g.40853 Transcript_12453/m.40853 type:complete len:275 (-) Transcript_12453:162-986(-)
MAERPRGDGWATDDMASDVAGQQGGRACTPCSAHSSAVVPRFHRASPTHSPLAGFTVGSVGARFCVRRPTRPSRPSPVADAASGHAGLASCVGGHAHLPVGHDGLFLPHPKRDACRLCARRRSVGLVYSRPRRLLRGGVAVRKTAFSSGIHWLRCTSSGGGGRDGNGPDAGACHAGVSPMVRVHRRLLARMHAGRGWDARRILGLRRGVVAASRVAVHGRSGHPGRPPPGSFVWAGRLRRRTTRRRCGRGGWVTVCMCRRRRFTSSSDRVAGPR